MGLNGWMGSGRGGYGTGGFGLIRLAWPGRATVIDRCLGGLLESVLLSDIWEGNGRAW